MQSIIQLMNGVDCWKCEPKPAVYISGGIDSCVVLHHLREKHQGDIYTFTAEFKNKKDTTGRARQVADYYETLHTEVIIDDFVPTLYKVMVDLPFTEPRYNIWPYWLAREAARLDCSCVFTGEGSDEIFGGYPDRSYLKGWSIQLAYINYSYEIIHKAFNLELYKPYYLMPYINGEFLKAYYDPPTKGKLRDAYKGIIPESIRWAPGQPPAFVEYLALWDKELSPYVDFPEGRPKTAQQVKDALQLLATDAWNKTRRMKVIGKTKI